MAYGNQRGFTLIEMLLSVGLIAALASLSLPIYASFNNRNDLDISTQTLAGMLRRAETYARNVQGDSSWGVKVQAGSAVLFEGDSYATRDSTADETDNIPTTITIGGTVSEVVFTKFTAAPSATGTITLTHTATNDVRTVTLNAKGMVDY
jgi:prepilin-type N-terminal cleavage/methylation domain-containing protein